LGKCRTYSAALDYWCARRESCKYHGQRRHTGCLCRRFSTAIGQARTRTPRRRVTQHEFEMAVLQFETDSAGHGISGRIDRSHSASLATLRSAPPLPVCRRVRDSPNGTCQPVKHTGTLEQDGRAACRTKNSGIPFHSRGCTCTSNKCPTCLSVNPWRITLPSARWVKCTVRAKSHGTSRPLHPKIRQFGR